MRKFVWFIPVFFLFFASCNNNHLTSVETALFSKVGAVWSEEQKAIVVSWKVSSQARGKILVERREGSGNFVKVAEVPDSVNVFTDYSVFDGISYVYRLTGFNSKGIAVSVTTEPVVPPDVFPPDTFIDISPSEPTARAFFTFTGVDRTAGYVDEFECRIDNSDWFPCKPPYENRSLSIGHHTFYVRAIDPSGNKDETPATYSWEVTATYWKMVDAGGSYTCGINQAGFLYCWGNNGWGRVGVPGQGYYYYPVKVNDSIWKVVSTGYMHTCGIQSDGTLWCWGYNYDGQLGVGEFYNSYYTPQQIGQDTDWVDVTTGYYHTCGVKADGTLWCWGNNNNGQLGLGDNSNYSSPQQVGSDSDWKSVSAGYYHTCALKTDGTLYCWGANNSGQLGAGNYLEYNAPHQVGANADWIELTTGGYFTCGLRQNGTLWCWGHNYYGQLGTGDYASKNSPNQVGTSTKWSFVKAGSRHVCGINDTKLYCWGENDYRQLGFESTTYRVNSPHIISDDPGITYMSGGEDHTCMIKNGWLYCWGNFFRDGQLGIGENGYIFEPTMTYSGKTVKMIKGGTFGNNTCLINSEDKLLCTGDNSYGTIGVGNTDIYFYNTFQQVSDTGTGKWQDFSIGNNFVCGIQDDHTLWCWGRNAYGRLGIGNTGNSYFPKQVGSDSNWSDISSGYYHACGVKSNGTLWCWGRNNYGQLGLGDNNNYNTPQQVGTDTDWLQVVTGSDHTCGLKDDGTIWCWGRNNFGQLGIGNTSSYNTPQQVGSDNDWVYITAGSIHNCAIKSDHSLYCWGDNRWGKLGLGYSSYRETEPLKVDGDYEWKAVDAGPLHTCAIQMDNTIRCWGYNNYGELGIKSRGSFYSPVKVKSSKTWQDVSAGNSFTCSIASDNKAYCFGRSQYGILGLEDYPWRITPQKVEPLWY